MRNRGLVPQIIVFIGIQIHAVTIEVHMEAPQKSKTRITIYLDPFLGIYLKDSKSAFYRDTGTSKFIAALFISYGTNLDAQ